MPFTPIQLDINNALRDFNSDYGTAYNFGTNWSTVGTVFETFVNKYLFPKISETRSIVVDTGNRFNWLAKEEEFVGQFHEDYVILDAVPVNMNLSKSEELMLKRNYPQMATKLYGQGQIKKQKFTLNNNDARLNFANLGDAVNYAIAVYRKRISDINVLEESEIKAMMIDYATNHVNDVRTATSHDDFFNKAFNALLNIQNNSAKYNESSQASGGALGRYTTFTDLSDVAILTSDSMKTFLLDTKLANTFQVSGLDLSNKIISFDDLGGVYKLTADVTITEASTLAKFRNMGDYQIEMGDVIPEDSVITWDVTDLDEFENNVEEIKPDTDMFAWIFDIKKLYYRKNTKDMLKDPFFNPEFDEVTYWLHYYSKKTVVPFYNSVVIKG